MASSDAEDRDSVNGAEEEAPDPDRPDGKQVRNEKKHQKPVKM